MADLLDSSGPGPLTNGMEAKRTPSYGSTASSHGHKPDEDGITVQQRSRSPVKQVIISLIIVALIAVTWTGSTQFTKTSLSNATNFDAPYFMVWFSTNWMIVCFPLQVLLMALAYPCFKGSTHKIQSPREVYRHASLVFGPSGITIRTLWTRTLLFTFFWIVANYTYSEALANISATETTIVFSSNLAMVYLLSLLLLRDSVVVLRVLAVLLAIGGNVLMVVADGLGTTTVVGIVCAIVAAFAAAIYKVLFKKLVGDASFSQVSLFMTMLGLCNLILSWPIASILILTETETIVWNLVPWEYICASAALALLFNLFVNVGIAYTHPVYISVGMVLGLPLNAAVDAIWRGVTLTAMEIGGGVCIVVSFLLLLLPEDFTQMVLRKMGIIKGQSGRDSRRWVTPLS